jgi:hypothetical protein
MHTKPSEGKMQSEGSVCPYVTGTVTRYCTLTPFTLTDAEREAIELCAAAVSDPGDFRPALYQGDQIAATLRGLLERTDAQNI